MNSVFCSYFKTYLSTFCSWNEHTTQSVLLRNSVSAVAFGPKITKQKSLRNDFPQCTHTDKKHEALCLFLQGILLHHVMYTNALNWKTLQIRQCTWKFKHQQYIHQSTNQHTLRILTSLNSSSSFRCSIASFSALFLCSFSTFSYFFQYSSIWCKIKICFHCIHCCAVSNQNISGENEMHVPKLNICVTSTCTQ